MIYDVQADGMGGVCFNCKIMDRIRETSLLLRLAFGLKSQSLAILSHSCPGSSSVGWLTNSFSAFLWVKICHKFNYRESRQYDHASSQNLQSCLPLLSMYALKDRENIITGSGNVVSRRTCLPNGSFQWLLCGAYTTLQVLSLLALSFPSFYALPLHLNY